MAMSKVEIAAKYNAWKKDKRNKDKYPLLCHVCKTFANYGVTDKELFDHMAGCAYRGKGVYDSTFVCFGCFTTVPITEIISREHNCNKCNRCSARHSKYNHTMKEKRNCIEIMFGVDIANALVEAESDLLLTPMFPILNVDYLETVKYLYYQAPKIYESKIFDDTSRTEQKVKESKEPKVPIDKPGIPECTICLNNQCNVTYRPCGHYSTCAACYKEWSAKSDSCPTCRQKIDHVDFGVIYTVQ